MELGAWESGAPHECSERRRECGERVRSKPVGPVGSQRDGAEGLRSDGGLTGETHVRTCAMARRGSPEGADVGRPSSFDGAGGGARLEPWSHWTRQPGAPRIAVLGGVREVTEVVHVRPALGGIQGARPGPSCDTYGNLYRELLSMNGEASMETSCRGHTSAVLSRSTSWGWIVERNPRPRAARPTCEASRAMRTARFPW